MRQLILCVSIAAALGVVAVGCTRSPSPAAETTANTPAATPAAAAKIIDQHSYAEPEKVSTTDLALDLAVDFDKKQLSGTATYALDWHDKDAMQLVLDTRDISVQKAEGLEADGKWAPLEFALAGKDPILGSKLSINTPTHPAKVRVTYATSPEASGLQWLEPSMTEGKSGPFMFSQSQQIHARSWVPLQDTPQIRFTYSAHVTAPADAMVLMSADNDPAAVRDGDYSFKMPQKIPSYLLAIAAGDLVFKPLGERSGVWAEPTMVDKAAAEFADTEKMIDAAEALYGPVSLGALRPAGAAAVVPVWRHGKPAPDLRHADRDRRRQVAGVAGGARAGAQLVGQPGDVCHRQRCLAQRRHHHLRAEPHHRGACTASRWPTMEEVIDRNELKEEYKTLDPKLQILSLKPGDLADPDNASSATVYTKGAWFLQFLEKRFGREVFDPYLRGYFDHFAFQSITTQQFADYLKANLLDKHPGVVTDAEVEAWLHEPGIPNGAPQVESAKFSTVSAARIAWQGSGNLPNQVITDDWTTQEWVHFLEGMPDTLKPEQLAQLDAAYGFTGTPNGEIAMRWYPLAERSGYAAARPEMGKFLERVGRRKLIMPTYKALVATTDGLAFAKDVFARARPGYHPITTGSVEAMIAGAKPVATPPKAQPKMERSTVPQELDPVDPAPVPAPEK